MVIEKSTYVKGVISVIRGKVKLKNRTDVCPQHRHGFSLIELGYAKRGRNTNDMSWHCPSLSTDFTVHSEYSDYLLCNLDYWLGGGLLGANSNGSGCRDSQIKSPSDFDTSEEPGMIISMMSKQNIFLMDVVTVWGIPNNLLKH